jgi:hypothetical protein
LGDFQNNLVILLLRYTLTFQNMVSFLDLRGVGGITRDSEKSPQKNNQFENEQ